MEKELDLFLASLKVSRNTYLAYSKDLEQYMNYLVEKMADWRQNDSAALFLQALEYSGQKESSLARKFTVLKRFYRFAQNQGWVKVNPLELLARPKVKAAAPVILSCEEIEALLEAPDSASFRGLRDKAILEILYATGMKVSELLRLRVDDIYLDLDYIRIAASKERIIPLGSAAKKAVAAYLVQGREKLAGSSPFLFLNQRGEALTRQGVWKIIRGYAEKIGLKADLTPQILRDSFAAHLLLGGADLGTVKELLGYSDLAAADKFLKFKQSRLKDVYEAAHPRS